MPDYLHNHKEFKELLRAVEHEKSIDSSLVEKDYWMMHVLYGLQQGKFEFELKGGTSLSKGYNIIHRFSEDIDICIEPPMEMDVKVGKNHIKPQHCESRKNYYDWLAKSIKIDGIEKIIRDIDFDDEIYREGIRTLLLEAAYNYEIPIGEQGFDERIGQGVAELHGIGVRHAEATDDVQLRVGVAHHGHAENRSASL